MKMKILVWAVVLAVLTGMPCAAASKKKPDEKAAPGANPAQPAPAPAANPKLQLLGVEFFKKRGLALDKSQEGKMELLLLEYNKEKIKQEAKIQYRELEFLEMFNQSELEYEKLEAKFKEIAAFQADLGSFRVRKLMEAKQFLTAEQSEKYKKILLKIFFQ